MIDYLDRAADAERAAAMRAHLISCEAAGRKWSNCGSCWRDDRPGNATAGAWA